MTSAFPEPPRIRRVLGWVYLGVATLFGLGLIGLLYSRSRPPPPPPLPPKIPKPAALSPEDRRTFDQAERAENALVTAAVASRIWRYQPPEPGGWPGGYGPALAATLEQLPRALTACGWEGHLRIVDCRRDPCVARLEGGYGPETCEDWPPELGIDWTARTEAAVVADPGG